MYGTFGQQKNKFTVIYGAYLRFWPTQCVNEATFRKLHHKWV